MKTIYTDLYKLNPKITLSMLRKNGFTTENIYRKSVYKDMIQFELEVDLEEKKFSYSVNDLCNGQLYIPFYNSYYGGVNKVLNHVEKSVKDAFRGLEKKNILVRIENENSRKVS